MTAIWFLFAAMTGAAVLALLWPLSRRPNPALPEAGAESLLATETGFYEDQLRDIERDRARGLIGPGEAEAARAEAARRLLRASRTLGTADAPRVGEPALRHRRAASAFALSTVPLVALIVYGLYGAPSLPSQPQAERLAAARDSARDPAGRDSATRDSATRDLASGIAQIETHLAKHPEDGRGWEVLAPVYLRLGRTEDAVRAYESALRLLGDSGTRLADYGEALVASADGMVSGQARGAFERSLAADPSGVKPRFYLARAAEQDGDRALALSRYAALAEASPADAPWMPLLRESIQRLGGTPPAGGPRPESGARPEGEAKPEGGAKPALPGSGGTPPGEAGPGLSEEQRGAIRGMVAGLDRRLAAQGGSPEEWARLVRSYGVMGERDRAAEALARARAALGGEAGPVEAVARELGLAAP
ncbi:cytochrome c-type biogenesis protein CcmI [Methylobacterium sp. 4-46]|uniref:c-type cytochrome biogenesis protein CcmI n=1 Tax=unclassified Methylobacterium TaxID=2615210 RepID=UPI000165CCA6|nr:MULTISPECIES: c-type cytochrome biogenesis protein CcmI [Methylobacterium]ACA18775.1 cytochrome c-type biogenesis protein CcmI [Methylobacterium sp. 4-46]WFT78004.1 c-type cytochrome biogenesis protein CcmI [Methylobacterium nodulans]